MGLIGYGVVGPQAKAMARAVPQFCHCKCRKFMVDYRTPIKKMEFQDKKQVEALPAGQIEHGARGGINQA